MILFVHGFGSRGLGTKSQALREHFGADQVLTPNLSSHPSEALRQLEQLIDQHPVDLLVGSSLGGYYATWLNHDRVIPAVLINPAVQALGLLPQLLGEHQYDDGEKFTFDVTDAADLRGLFREHLRPEERYLVLLQTGDEILDYREAAAYYASKDLMIEPAGNHRFENFHRYLPRIAAWRQQYV